MTDTDAIVFVVDDDERIRQSLKNLVRFVGLRVEGFASAQEFLRASSRMCPPAWCSTCGCRA